MGTNVQDIVPSRSARRSSDALAQSGAAPEKRIAVIIDAGQTQAPISPYLYGQFIEHIGDLVNRSVWAEMLDDRKFYYAVTSATAEPARRRLRSEAAARTAGSRSGRMTTWLWIASVPGWASIRL